MNNNIPWNPNFIVPPPPPKPNDHSGMAIASFVTGLVGLLMNFICMVFLSPILGILGVVFGCVSLRSRNRGLAIAGVILGGLAILFAIVLVGFVIVMAVNGSEWHSEYPFLDGYYTYG